MCTSTRWQAHLGCERTCGCTVHLGAHGSANTQGRVPGEGPQPLNQRHTGFYSRIELLRCDSRFTSWQRLWHYSLILWNHTMISSSNTHKIVNLSSQAFVMFTMSLLTSEDFHQFLSHCDWHMSEYILQSAKTAFLADYVKKHSGGKGGVRLSTAVQRKMFQTQTA